MDIKQLRYFLMIAELKSLTAAAERLNVTQPALGQQIRNMETGLGVTLIERHSRGVRLTEAGRLLLTHAEDILTRVRRAEADLKFFSGTPAGAVRIGVTPSLGRAIVPKLLETCSDQFPDIALQFAQGFTDQLERQLEQGDIDLGIAHSTMDTVIRETVPLYVEEIKLIGRPELMSGIPDPISLQALSQLPLVLDERSQQVRKIIDTALTNNELVMRDAVEISAVNIRREFVMQGKRCSLAPPALFSDEIESGSLLASSVDNDSFTRVLHLAGPRVETMSPAFAAIRTLIIHIIDEEIHAGRYGWRMPSSVS